MNLVHYSIADLLPHSGRMILIDDYHHIDNHQCVCEVTIRSNHLFADEQGRVPSYVGLEMMAQAIALIAGWQWRQKGEKPRVGFLLGARSYDASLTHFLTGQTLIIKIGELYREDNGMAAYDCNIMLADQSVATSRLSVFEPRDATAFIQEGKQ